MSLAIIPVIVAGGQGTRLWPLSRTTHPKQFLKFDSDRSSFQRTLLRLAGLRPGDHAIVVSNEEYRFLVREQLQECGLEAQAIVLEPAGRGSAAALTLAACLAQDRDAVLIMAPADHRIEDEAAFASCLERALAEAAAGVIVAIGIAPSRPETGYGYLKCGALRTGHGGGAALEQAYELAQFVEKPALAQSYLDSGNYLWNSGIYVLQAAAWLRAIGRFRPGIAEACAQAVQGGKRDGDFFRPGREAFLRAPADSVDYAVMERAAGSGEFPCAVVRCETAWADLGSWMAVWETGRKDANGNVTGGDVVAVDSRDSLLLSSGRLIAALGLEDLVVAETPDAVLVARLSAAQSVSTLVEQMKSAGRSETELPHRVLRPWGTYESFVKESNYVVKRLTINPGRRLSLQLHKRRSEHWVVVQGQATVQRGDETLTLRCNESLFITPGTLHRLGNDGDDPLIVIEVQTGDYLGEDDIVRYADDFGRSGGEPH